MSDRKQLLDVRLEGEQRQEDLLTSPTAGDVEPPGQRRLPPDHRHLPLSQGPSAGSDLYSGSVGALCWRGLRPGESCWSCPDPAGSLQYCSILQPLHCQDVCVADGGAPLVCRAESGRWTVVGVLTWSVDCEASPGVFLNIATVRDWITSVQ